MRDASCCSMHALSWQGDRSLRKVDGLVRPRPLWSKGASGSTDEAPACVEGTVAIKEQFCFVLVVCIYLPYLSS